jgi:hypothetical protein
MSPLRGQLVNTLPHKQVIARSIEPDEWFFFSKAATSGIIDQHYAEEAK